MIEALRLEEIKQVSSYDYFAACLTMTGDVYLWGKLSYIGLSDASSLQLVQRQKGVLEVACGYDHALILQEDGVYAIGYSCKGQCGLGYQRTKFTKVDGLDGKDIIKIACGFKCSAALTRSGQVYVWGRALCGIKDEPTTRPALIQLDDVVDISVGGAHVLALDRQDRVFAWGENECGQCGVNSSAEWINTPTHVPNVEIYRVLQITTGKLISVIKYQ